MKSVKPLMLTSEILIYLLVADLKTKIKHRHFQHPMSTASVSLDFSNLEFCRNWKLSFVFEKILKTWPKSSSGKFSVGQDPGLDKT